VDPVTKLGDLDVKVTRTADGEVLVELVDKRTRTELVSLTPRAASALAGVLMSKAARAMWIADNGGQP
jgi:hypothetical protein